MACLYHPAHSVSFSIANKILIKPFRRSRVVLISSLANRGAPHNYNKLVFEAVRLLVPPARFEASKLNVILLEEGINIFSAVIPRTYILSHCDYTANLTLSISNVINLEQLRGWYCKDDVVAEWKKVNGILFLHVHCFVSGPNNLLDLTAELRYLIFSKELPLVIKAILYGDSVLFDEHPELMNSPVRVYFHSSLKKYNRIEYWGPLQDAAEGLQVDGTYAYIAKSKDVSRHLEKQIRPKSIFQALFAFLL